ncbi:SAG family member [Eimeria mitis]|uniref:SAG family member n=1 Tax=Eimeria mitis TaxID=44415 RepID=U6KEJ5_9EIME|nr:SAG family member [Eimeria mitis]CDJ33878.1 SAG family member [Eimeria mitis]
MTALKLFSLASASAFLMANAVHQTAKQSQLTPSEGSATYTVNLGKTPVCLAEINNAREAAGLAHFKEATDEMWPTSGLQRSQQQANPWDPVCKALIAKDSEEEETPKNAGTSEFKSATYAFMALTTDQADCAAAVDHWKDAVNNFSSLPPSKAEDKELYDKPENVSFVAMYNPSESAIADCRVVTCTETPANPDQAESFSSRNNGEAKTGYALLCMTTPDLMTATSPAPFSEDQWSKIKASLTGSASVAAPSLIAFAIAALGLAAF